MTDQAIKKKYPEFEFHGERTAIDDDHNHYRAAPADLEGETILKFVCDADNAWSLHFTDGTAVAIECEVGSIVGVPYMEFCDTCWKGDAIDVE